MDGIFTIFAPNDFSLIAVILGMPLIGAFVNGVWGRRLGKDAVRFMALAAIGASFLAALVTAGALWSLATKSETAHQGHAEHVKLVWLAWEWMHTTGGHEVNVPIDLKFSIDALSATMMLVVTGVGFLIHLYATSYMREDKAYWRFFCYLNLFIFSMLILILGDNLPVLFVGWEGVGLCSYLLIGFWYTKEQNATAGKKAFIANRIGDFGLIVGMFLLVHYTGALDWTGIENGAGSLVTTAKSTRVHLWPIGGGEFVGRLGFLQPHHPLTISAATAIGLALLLGCTGKSAQIPLYVWLPDAMAGPTPVSALIHAATMVTAGIYLVCRLSFVFVLSPFTMTMIACIGGVTALFAATIALVQNDIKKVLAYSTVSQLGFMFLGVGSGAFTAGFFHVLTHAFFKACLFLGAGSVIHAMHARIHDDELSQDMRKMGGLKKYMPYTFWTFAAATAAIIGLPLTSGFFSKDEILFRAYVDHPVSPYAERVVSMSKGKMHLYEPPTWIGPTLYVVGLLAATLTAFYMCRLLFMTFFGEFRGWTIGRPSMLSAPDSHEAGHDHDDEEEEEHHHHAEDLTQPGRAPHESPWQMTVPLMILAVLSLFAGFLNPAVFKETFNMESLPLDHWLDPTFEEATKGAVKVAENAHHIEWYLTLGAFGAFAVGTYLAYWMYIQKKGEPAQQMAESAGALYKGALNKWYVDEIYGATIVNGTDALADTAAAVDQSIVDGIIARATSLVVAALGTVLRTVQTGVVHVYAGLMVLGIAVLGFFFVLPHPDATVTQKTNGDFVLEAAPGIGYGYQWYPDASGKPSHEGFTGDNVITLHPQPGQTATAKLRVVNAFGLTREREFTVESPPAPEKPEKQLKLGQNP
jgi:NADH-quinone oxidoreductase subunit L